MSVNIELELAGKASGVNGGLDLAAPEGANNTTMQHEGGSDDIPGELGHGEESARVVYEPREVVAVPMALLNQVHRHGLVPPKAGEDKRILFEGPRRYHVDGRTHSPSGSRIIHKDDLDPRAHPCEAIAHPPYGYVHEYRGEDETQNLASTDLATLASTANLCGFCAIIYQGVQNMRDEWVHLWAQHTWANAYTIDEELWRVYHDRPWLEQFKDEIEGRKGIDEQGARVLLRFPTRGSLLLVILCLPPWPPFLQSRPLQHESVLPPNRNLASLEFFADAARPSQWTSFHTYPMPHTQRYGEDTLKCLKQWFEDCWLGHPACKHSTHRDMPKRLIHITTTDSAEHGWQRRQRLIETSQSQHYDYIALSHTWARSHPLRTTHAVLDRYKNEIPTRELSSCLLDAVLMTVLWGFRYIWIDSLCIVQDDGLDWEEEAPRMGRIYQNAALVIAAHGPDLGLKKKQLQPISDPFRPNDPPVYCRHSLKEMHNAFYSDPILGSDRKNWFGRAWCMQERLFARRILHFGGRRDEIVFECCTSIKCECGRIVEDQMDPDNERKTMKMKFARGMLGVDVNTPDELWHFYIEACTDYTARGLTFGLDSLPAISSIMSTISTGLGKYYAGIWEYAFLISLQWEAVMTEDCKRHDTFVAPSWSWASRSGAVMWYMHEINPSTAGEKYDFATIINVACTLATADPYGKVSAGQLTVTAFMVEKKIESMTMHKPDGRLRIGPVSESAPYVTLDSMQDFHSVKEGTTVFCLDIMRDKDGGGPGIKYVSALVLREAETAGMFRRIGFSTMKEEDFELAKRSVVCII